MLVVGTFLLNPQYNSNIDKGDKGDRAVTLSFTVSFMYVQQCRFTLSIPGGGKDSALLGTSLNNSKTPKDNEIKFSHLRVDYIIALTK